MKKLLLIITTIYIILICDAQEIVNDIDGNIYNIVKIGSQKWMKENLKTTHYRNGDSIGTTYPATKSYMNENTPKYQWAYDGDESSVPVYGRLYTGYVVTDNRKVCPTGWHVPTSNEWETLIEYLGGGMVAHGKLKETGTTHWNSPNSDATNESGFTGLPGGMRGETTFEDKGISGHYWAANEQYPGWLYRLLLNYEPFETTYFLNSASPDNAWAIRCLEDPIPDSAKYFGQTPPGDTAVIFAPGIISLTNRFESDITVSPDGNEVYFNANNGVYFTKRVNNVWSDQLIEPIFNGFQQPTFSANGGKMYLFKYNTGATKSDLWVSERSTTGWGEPQILPAPFNIVNTRTDGYSEISDSVMYISSNRSGNSAIWCIRRLTDQSFQAEKLNLNMDSYKIGNPVIAPDGSYLIFDSNKKDNEGNAGFYVSFKKGNNEWSVPVNLEKSHAKINISDYFQIYPALSPDGKYLFFNRHFQVAGVWTMDIYWVSTHILDTLKKIALPTGLVNKTIEQHVKLYPNPTKGLITLNLGTNQNHKSLVEIYNLQGTLVFSKILHNTTSATIDLMRNAAGIYVVKVIADGVSYEEKIIKE
jgi:uncharacterized protein (TIGR02145 family)